MWQTHYKQLLNSVETEVTYTNFSYHGVHIWNIIVQNIPPSISYNSFKHLSKIFIQKNDIHYRLRS